MKPARFRYLAPTTVDEAIAALAENPFSTKVLAGGQSLIPLMNMRLARPELVLDINRIPELSYISVRNGELAIGALTRQRLVERSPEVASHCPLLVEAIRLIGYPQIRNRGTIGGSIAHADPSAELPTVLAALGGRVVVQGPGEKRVINYEEFFLTYFTTTLGPDEIVTEVVFPLPEPGTGWSFQEVARREGDFALVGVAALVTRGADDRIRSVSLALSGVGGTPLRIEPAEAVLVDQKLEQDVLAAVVAKVREAIEPEDDIHATADYRRHVAGVLVARALKTAWERASLGGEAK